MSTFDGLPNAVAGWAENPANELAPTENYPIEKVLELLRSAQPGPAPAPPRAGFLDRLGAGLANIQSPGASGRPGDVFAANLMSGFGQSFGGQRTQAREEAFKRQMADYERSKAQKATEVQAQLGAVENDFETRRTKSSDAARALREWARYKRDTEAKQAETATARGDKAASDVESKRRWEAEHGIRLSELGIKRAEANKKSQPGGELKPPSAGERERLVALGVEREQLGEIRRLFKKEFVGPLSGPIGALQGKLGDKVAGFIPGVGKASKGEFEFRGALASFRNKLINRLAGANVPESEKQRMYQQIPTEDESSESFLEKLAQTEANIDLIDRIERDTMTKTGVDLSGLDAPGATSTRAAKRYNPQTGKIEAINAGR